MAAVVGCGIIGLTGAIRLLEAGHDVTIYARDLPPRTTSDAAAAIWYVYAVQPLERAIGWARKSLDVYKAMAQDPASGVTTITMRDMHVEPPKDLWWREFFPEAKTMPPPAGYAEAYLLDVPRIEPSIHLPYLMARVKVLGGRIERRELAALDELYNDHALILHSSGVWARDLADDVEVYPIRGQVVVVEAPQVTQGYLDEHNAAHPTYILPRSRDCVLGGTAWVEHWDTQPDGITTEQIVARCAAVEPSLRDAPVVSVNVGLRPGRRAVRLEREQVTPTCTVIHNYGHGGAGFTLAWGCADEAAALADAPSA